LVELGEKLLLDPVALARIVLPLDEDPFQQLAAAAGGCDVGYQVEGQPVQKLTGSGQRRIGVEDRERVERFGNLNRRSGAEGGFRRGRAVGGGRRRVEGEPGS